MRPCVVAAVVLALAAHATLATADWAVRRTGTRALEEQGVRALVERPDDAALAARLVRLAGKGGAAALRARFEARARATDARYADLAAYATLLAALGADEDAVAAFARAAALRPEPAMLAGRARALARAGHRAEAVSAYDEAVARGRAPAEKRRLLEAEVALLEAPADLERELTIRRALASLDPRSDDAAEHVADVLERLGRPAEAAELLEARRPKDATARFNGALRVAALRDAAGDDTRAAAILAELLRALPPTDVERRRLAWTRAVAVARHGDGLPALEAALARDAGPVEWDVLGQVRDELGDLEGALEAERRAAGPHPSAELGRRIVALLDRLGRDDEAVAVYEDLARRAPTDPSWSLELVERELRRGRRKQADAHFDVAAARFARSPSATVRLAELASRWGEDARALSAWERARKLAPRDEQAILGLGETQFATGKQPLALRTWQALRERAPSVVAGRLRLAEVLLEHDLLAEALAEAQEAGTRAPRQPGVHRLLAQILERQRQTDAAVREWDLVIALAAGPANASVRREARTRILTLLARTNRGRLDERVRSLEAEASRDPADREGALFLAEAQQRLGNLAGAIATLRRILDGDPARRATTAGGANADEANADLTLALVRLLRANGQTEEAVHRLEVLAARAPTRAREAHVQIADVELGRHDEAVALAHAAEAARLAPGDGQALARIAAIQERAGDDARALDTYRRAFEDDADATAGFALASMLERRGEVAEAADVLRRLLETATDDDVILEAGRRSIELDEYLGRLPQLEQLVARDLYAGARAPVMRRVLVEVLRRLLPPLYHASGVDVPAGAARARLAQHSLRPLLELVADADGRPDRALVELLGMLGNKDAAPVLARLAAPATDPAHEDGTRSPASAGGDTQVAAVIALGRLGDGRGHDVLETLAVAPDGRLRAAAVWALGRVAEPRDAPLFTHALRDARADVVGLACLGLGRAHAPEAASVLVGVATDVARPRAVRRAAVAGLALAADRAAVAPLLALTRAGDEALARAALLSLGALRDARARPALLEAALLAPAPTGGEDGAAGLALGLWASGGALPDEAMALEGTRVELDAVLAGLEPSPSSPARVTLSRDDLRAARDAIVEGLQHPGARRSRALAVLDGHDTFGLEAVTATVGPSDPRARDAALAELAEGARDAVAPLLDDADPDVRARALRVLASTNDARVTVGRVLRAATGGPSEQEAATTVTKRWTTTAPGEARALAEPLSAALRDAPGWTERLGIVEALGALGEAGIPALRRALDDRSLVVRAAAASALRRPAPETTLPLDGDAVPTAKPPAP